ncbi:hypothetical protein [Streptomyces sp. RP5T]|uniref:hypothetical protein n=1 Tax=Streptomyces sp. RP5T TaxID=2490848 RepID=UPI00163A02B3|nr:hypothetical protein [Streptomyces sp. RP5T]
MREVVKATGVLKDKHGRVLDSTVPDDALITDAVRLLGHRPEEQLAEKAANAVGLLDLVVGQEVEPAEDSDARDGRWRITGDRPGAVVASGEQRAS